MRYQLENGLDVEISWDTIEEPDRDSGIFSPYVNDFWITAVGGRKCSSKVSQWLGRRLSAIDEECIANEIVENYY